MAFKPKLFSSLIKVAKLNWHRIFEDSRLLKGLLQRVLLIITGGVTKEHSIAIHLYSESVRNLGRRSGWLYTALYLKQCSSSLQRAIGGDSVVPVLLPVMVSLSRRGLPRLIPSFHRKMIRKGDQKSDELVKFYLSLFSVSKLILLAVRIDKRLFQSITDPVKDLNRVKRLVGSLIKSPLESLLVRYAPLVSSLPLNQGVSWKPTWKTLPTYSFVKKVFRSQVAFGLDASLSPEVQSVFTSFMFELAAWQDLMQFCHKRGEQWSQGVLFPQYVRYAFDPANDQISESLLSEFELKVGSKLPSPEALGIPGIPGRLGQVLEGGGKRRVFAIGNYVNQRLLQPVHDWLMEILRSVPMDGTFDQQKPLDRLVGRRVAYSFDLKSATDRFPLLILFTVFRSLFGTAFASSVVNSTLATNVFDVPFAKPLRNAPQKVFLDDIKLKAPSTVSFVAGQPLGYLSSWPLFALSHHVLVWWCAEQVHPSIRFDRYAILGDDIVISDSAVAMVYSQVLEELGVIISYQKSLISHKGAAEFAKRFKTRCLSVDLSPISVKCLTNHFHPFGMMAILDRYPSIGFSTFCRIGGLGYKSLAKLDVRPFASSSIERMWAYWTHSRLPTDLWFGQGLPVNPYIHGALVVRLRSSLIPKDLSLPPEEYFPGEQVATFQEYTCYRGWQRLSLSYLLWYCSTALREDVTLDELLEAPIVTTKWKACADEEAELRRFGLKWKLYEWVRSVGPYWRLPILPSGSFLVFQLYRVDSYFVFDGGVVGIQQSP